MLMKMTMTPRCLRAVEFGREFSGRAGMALHSGHLIFGLLKLGGGVAVNVLVSEGAFEESVREYFLKWTPSEHESVVEKFGMRMAESAALAFERAEKEAARCNHTYLGTEHLLLALLSEKEGPASDYFGCRGFDRARIREVVLKELG